jgi:hypothetical protein
MRPARGLLRRLNDVKHLRVSAVPFFAALTLIISFFSAGKSLDTLGAFRLWSLFFFLGTIVLPFSLSAASTSPSPSPRRNPPAPASTLLVSWYLLATPLWTHQS